MCERQLHQLSQASRWLLALGSLTLLATGCDFPRDAAGTLDRIRAEKVLHVGYSPRPPWVVIEAGRPAGIEVRLIERYASRLGATVEWLSGSETSLIEALRQGNVDFVIGGHERASVWRQHASLSRPHSSAELIVAGPPGEALRSSDLEGRRVAYHAGRPHVAALIAKANAHPWPADNLKGQIAALYKFEADGEELVPTGIVLAREDIVFLVRKGESAFLLSLDRFAATAGTEPNKKESGS